MIKDLEVYVPGETDVGMLIKIDIIFRSGMKLALVDEARNTEIKNGVFCITVSGRFNYARMARFSIDLMRITLVNPNKEANEGSANKNSRRRDGKKEGRR